MLAFPAAESLGILWPLNVCKRERFYDFDGKDIVTIKDHQFGKSLPRGVLRDKKHGQPIGSFELLNTSYRGVERFEVLFDSALSGRGDSELAADEIWKKAKAVVHARSSVKKDQRKCFSCGCFFKCLSTSSWMFPNSKIETAEGRQGKCNGVVEEHQCICQTKGGRR